MKMRENTDLLSRKQRIDAERKAQAILRRRHQTRMAFDLIAGAGR